MVETEYHPAPKWLTKDYLEPLLQKYKKDNTLKIAQMDIKPATAKGENYASIMTRIKVKFNVDNNKNELQCGSYIVKTTYENDPFISELMQSYNTFKTEMAIYEKILPKLSELLRETGDKDKLFAESIYVDYEHSAIIFEDLAVENFTIADRLAGFDLTHTKLALKKLAKLHATAAVFNERQPGILTQFDHGIFNRHSRGFALFFENMIEVCAEVAGACEELGDYYKQKLLKLREYVVEYGTRACDPKADFFNTLTHGDFWVNNIMLSYSNGSSTKAKKIKDSLLIDFQFSTWGSPSIDLHYFFNTSLENDLRAHHQDALVQYYYQTLSETLRALKFKGRIPSLHEFWLQVQAGEFYAVTSAFTQQPMMINDKTEEANINNLIGTSESAVKFRRTLYTNEKILSYVKQLLPYFDRRGLLDVEEKL